MVLIISNLNILPLILTSDTFFINEVTDFEKLSVNVTSTTL
jgi:hypothetical protein